VKGKEGGQQEVHQEYHHECRREQDDQTVVNDEKYQLDQKHGNQVKQWYRD
jgi:hypothetical protein